MNFYELFSIFCTKLIDKSSNYLVIKHLAETAKDIHRSFPLNTYDCFYDKISNFLIKLLIYIFVRLTGLIIQTQYL